MVKWIFGLFLLFGLISCQSDTTTDAPDISLPPESGTVASSSKTTVPLIFFQKEIEILNSRDRLSIGDSSLFRSLPPGVYPIESDTILFEELPKQWISSGITRWPRTGKVALADFIISDTPIFTNEIAIFPQKPAKNGYLPGCFGCPDWIARQYGALAIFWEKNQK